MVHGNIRCRKLLVSCHNENSFTVKLADPGIRSNYESKEYVRFKKYYQNVIVVFVGYIGYQLNATLIWITQNGPLLPTFGHLQQHFMRYLRMVKRWNTLTMLKLWRLVVIVLILFVGIRFVELTINIIWITFYWCPHIWFIFVKNFVMDIIILKAII